MIPFECSFTRAESVDELVTAWVAATRGGQTAHFFGGGTEVVTLAREHKFHTDVLIDYKRVPEATVFGPGLLTSPEHPGERYAFGAAVRLSALVDAPGAGLFARCAGGVADRTVRNSITLGGNVCGMLPYREAVLPFLLLDGTVVYAEPTGVVDDPVSTGDPAGGHSGSDPTTVARVAERPIREMFSKKILLPEGAAVLAFAVGTDVLRDLGLFTDTGAVGAPAPGCGAVTATGGGEGGRWFYRRRTADARVDYPLVTVAMADLRGEVRLAVSGAWGYPVRATAAEGVLAAAGTNTIAALSTDDRRRLAEEAVDAEDRTFKKDQRGSRAYRRELTIQAVEDGLAAITGGAS